MKAVVCRISLCVLFAGASLRAQSTFSAILGALTDASGAVVQGASLTLRNLDENTSTTLASDSQGLYQFLNLKAGRYQLTAEHPGFRTARTPEILLEARVTRRADFTLEIAPRAETLEVTASLPTVDADNGTVADSKNFEQVTRLPLNSRALSGSPFWAILTVPGVQVDRQGGVSIGGGLPAQVEYSVDGISTIDIVWHGANYELAPSSEMLGEFRVTSVNNTAAFSSMADVTVVTRSGSNQVHGSALWYHQNRALDVKTYGLAEKSPKVVNRFGGSLSGPVYVPGFYNGRNRTFFFLDYEGHRYAQSYINWTLVPTASMRQGDLTGVPGGAALDPSSGAPFPGNRIPANRINAVPTRLLTKYYPLPNVTEAYYNLLIPIRADSSTDGYDWRVDHVLGPRQRVFARWSWKKAHSLGVGYGYLLPQSTYITSNKNLVLAHTLTPSAGLSNEFRFGLSLSDWVEHFPIRGRDAVADLGLAGLDLHNAGDAGGFPFFDFSDGTMFETIGHPRPEQGQSRNVQFTDTLSWVHARHTLKFGADVRRVGFRQTWTALPADDFGGWFFYSNTFSGNAFANLLLGLPAQTLYAVLGPTPNGSARHAGFFAQDNWRVSARLSLEFGLRWEVHPPMTEAVGNLASLDQSTGDVIVPDHTLPPAPGFLAAIHACSVASNSGPCTKILTASQAGLPQGLRKTDYGDWNPRFGFAFQPWSGGKTVLRGGVGAFTQTLLGGVTYHITGSHSSDVRTFGNSLGTDGQPLVTLPNILPGPAALGQLGTEVFSCSNPTLRDPRSWQWNFTVERALPLKTTLRASYIGVQSAGMTVHVDLNQVPASTRPFSQARRPYPLWGYLTSIENVGFANYQGLQMEATRRFRNGFFFQGSYIFSKNLGAAGTVGRMWFPGELNYPGLTDRYNVRYDRGNLGGSRRNRFLLTGLFPLPFGKGRALGAKWRGARQAVLGGWELSTVTLVQSGPYQTPIVGVGLDQSNTDVSGRVVRSRPDRIGNGNLAHPTRDRYYDKSAFAFVPKGAGRFGNAGVGILEGPGTVAIAGGLAKTFQLAEKLRLRLEGTFTNLPNHPNFLAPNTTLNSPSFGVLMGVQSSAKSGNRTGQIAARLDF